MHPLFAGAISGLTATAPMTIAMESMFRDLPAIQRHPLPPRVIAVSILKRLDANHRMHESPKVNFSLVAHFGYGASVGAVYGAVARQAFPGILGGIAFGVGVFASCYLGWLPAAGLHRSAARMPTERLLLMLAAHVIWGGVLGGMTRWITNDHHRNDRNRKKRERP